MIGVRGEQREKGRRRMRRIAYRNVQFIGGDHFERWISILPPELVPDDGDFNRVCRRLRILNAADYAGRRQEQDDDDENGNDRPGELQLRASIDLGGLLSLRRCPSF